MVTKNNKYGLVAIIIITLIYFVSRFLIISTDVPAWDISNYCPIDELYYSAPAFDWLFGSNSPSGEVTNVIVNHFYNMACYVSLAFFGNNYIGLRLPSVIFGYIVLLVFYNITLSRFGLFSAISFSILLISEFSFFLASKVCEPTISRMACVAIILFFLLYYCDFNNKYHSWIAGFIAGLAVFFVYPTNLFLLPTITTIVLLNREWRTKKTLISFLLGVISSLFLYALISSVIFNLKIEDFNILNILSKRVSAEGDIYGIIYSLKDKVLDIFKANIFEYNNIFLVTLLFCVLMLITRYKLILSFENKEDFYTVLLLLFFLLQCIFVNDYPKRKLVFMYPFILYVYFIGLSLGEKFISLKLFRVTGMVVTILNLSIFLSVSYGFLIKERTYHYKEAMENMQFLDGEKLVGGLSFGFRLYNKSLPYLNVYEYAYTKKDEYVKKIKSDAMLGYAKNSITYHDEKTISHMRELSFYPERIILKSKDKKYPDVYLYKYREK